MRFARVTRDDWIDVVTQVGLFILGLVVAAYFLLPSYWYIFVFLTLFGAYRLVLWHLSNFGYHCSRCGHEFVAGLKEEFFGPNGLTKKYMLCPKCREHSWMDPVRIVDPHP